MAYRSILSVALFASIVLGHVGAFGYETKDVINLLNSSKNQPGLWMPNSGASSTLKVACSIAHNARLSVDSARGSCDGGNAVTGGSPPADDKCHAPSTSAGKTANEVSAQTGKHAIYSQQGARCTVNGNIVDNVPNGQTDCSGFVSGVLARSGVRLSPMEKLPVPLSTEVLKQKYEAGQMGCWRHIMGPKEPGDMCFYNNGTVGHVWIIDRVSESNNDNYTTAESTSATGANGPQIKAAKGAASDAKGGENVICLRVDGDKNGCVDPDASKMKYKDEDAVASCS